MREIRVLGHTTVTVTTVIKVPDGAALSEEEIYARTRKAFKGVQSLAGNGGTDKLLGVSGDRDTLAADEDVVFDDFMDE